MQGCWQRSVVHERHKSAPRPAICPGRAARHCAERRVYPGRSFCALVHRVEAAADRRVAGSEYAHIDFMAIHPSRYAAAVDRPAGGRAIVVTSGKRVGVEPGRHADLVAFAVVGRIVEETK
ncbi:hypothetical protein D3C80_823960 [compost metagenome]